MIDLRFAFRSHQNPGRQHNNLHGRENETEVPRRGVTPQGPVSRNQVLSETLDSIKNSSLGLLSSALKVKTIEPVSYSEINKMWPLLLRHF